MNLGTVEASGGYPAHDSFHCRIPITDPASISTDSNGGFRFPYVGPGKYVLYVDQDTEATIVVTTGQETDSTLISDRIGFRLRSSGPPQRPMIKSDSTCHKTTCCSFTTSESVSLTVWKKRLPILCRYSGGGPFSGFSLPYPHLLIGSPPKVFPEVSSPTPVSPSCWQRSK